MKRLALALMVTSLMAVGCGNAGESGGDTKSDGPSMEVPMPMCEPDMPECAEMFTDEG